ncbi:PEP-CTERM sorting domain-containing protein [Crocosphaera sp.]|uniref:PEP-CTERM sorting domain-containing protein n=1 Tax=Crocosphaera sp. TaxID=2729996 RepID=UPI003F2882CA|nr:PEP-CTERM sorting domain-containing protein [Crocosphaera sp.]
MNKTIIGALAFAATLGMTNAVQAATMQTGTMFKSTINGGNIVPTPIGSSITGFADLYLNAAQTELYYSINLDNAALDSEEDGTVTKIHFHTGFADEASPFHVLNIYGPYDDADADFASRNHPIVVSGIWSDADACTDDGCETDPATSKALTPYLDDLFAGGLYINIHTSKVGGGEVRGQIEPVPEPLTILGAGTAIAFATGFKRKLAKVKK